ncbi:MAG TPA: YicC/YloC family endoribonuclease [Burkholderiales bacterium]|nr:YicC/YloC family endoribonuclease [Burkholderiales bacterium]
MVSSMTGYAAVTRELAAGTLALELKSVNSRFLDVQFRIAEELRTVEPALRELAMAAVGRGKLDCRLAFTPSPLARDESALNGEALARLARMSQVVRDAIPDAQPFRVVEVLHWPGVLGDEPAAAERVRDAAVEAMRSALAELVAGRGREGEKLARMIRERLAKMRGRLAEIEPLVPKAIAAYEEKLAAKLREVLASTDEDRIRQEIAVFGVRIDVAEELSRLAAHLDEAERVLASGGAVGKRLDFLMQELNREANTLGAKSVSKELSAAVLEFKVLIEQMREQVQNLE